MMYTEYLTILYVIYTSLYLKFKKETSFYQAKASVNVQFKIIDCNWFSSQRGFSYKCKKSITQLQEIS